LQYYFIVGSPSHHITSHSSNPLSYQFLLNTRHNHDMRGSLLFFIALLLVGLPIVLVLGERRGQVFGVTRSDSVANTPEVPTSRHRNTGMSSYTGMQGLDHDKIPISYDTVELASKTQQKKKEGEEGHSKGTTTHIAWKIPRTNEIPG
jgi:hypothetical protein